MPRVRLLLAVVLGVLLLGACQAKAVVDVHAEADGHGTVSVSVGLDAAAVARLGDPDANLVVDDMRAAGWTVSPAVKGDDGWTWVRATKPFADSAALAGVMGELTAGGAFRDFRFTVQDDAASTTRTLSGTVDASKGIHALDDPELTGKLDNDPFGGQVQSAEADEHRPVADMVSVEVRVSVDGAAPQSYPVRLGDPTPIAVSAAVVETKPPAFLTSWIGLLVVAGALVVLVLMLVGLRRRFAHRSR